jgi:uncharacterized protein YjfI (DUF2170 family)
MIKRILWLLCLSTILVSTVHAQTSDYNIIVKGNGEALLIITLNGSGLFQLPLEEDVEQIKVKGALYNVENGTAEISIGSARKAIVLYKTNMLTSKEKEKWALDFGVISSDKTTVTLNLPLDAKIENMFPKAFVEEGDFKKIRWEGNISEVQVYYSFQSQMLPDVEDITTNKRSLSEVEVITTTTVSPPIDYAQSTTNHMAWLVFPLTALIVAALILGKRHVRSKSKHNIIKTLPKNEALIVTILTEHKGGIKRSKLEILSKIAKSSLASSLHNLEKKKIIGIDKTYTTHFIRFTKWFKEL